MGQSGDSPRGMVVHQYTVWRDYGTLQLAHNQTHTKPKPIHYGYTQIQSQQMKAFTRPLVSYVCPGLKARRATKQRH